MTDRAVYVVAKAPRSGQVKTRLCPPLEPEQAARLYAAFLLDSLGAAIQVPNTTVRVICPNHEMAAELEDLVPNGVAVVAQRSPGLGAALEEAFSSGLAEGHGAIAVVGSDNPTLPATLIQRAFEALDSDDVVIGPTQDGGYYLLAARLVYPTLFRDMVWSTSTVLQETLARCVRAGLSASLVDRWYDVDDGEALRQLQRALADIPTSSAPHTRRVLTSLEAVLATQSVADRSAAKGASPRTDPLRSMA